ncbi:MAG: alpha-L-arabinofuranosidase [Butyrivibrio sp.]|nr:alpha-L-arabinofuranosidase [Acetatifactor muris]MCM1559820.1 alpha-L-arabinofuranosidase [Butyrivibrio sp.]
MAKLSVETGKRRFETADSLYGLFFEDINRSGDGGLYPELLRNRAFDDSLHPDDLTEKGDDLTNSTGWVFEYQKGEGAKRWKEREAPTDIPAWYAESAQMSLEREDTLNDRRPAALRAVFEPGGKIYNVGYCGVPVRAGEAYCLYFFAKAGKAVKVVVALEAEGKTLCSGEIPVGGCGYVRYDMTLVPDKTAKETRLCLSVPEGGELLFGFISLMPGDTYHGHGLRKDLCEKLEGLHPAFLRFPGGCIVEGFSKSTAQRFKRMTGPVWERPGVLNLWGYHSTEGLGFHEYLQLCEDLKTDALYVCNVGMTCQARNCILMEEEEVEDLLDDVLCALEYALGSKDTEWGGLRARMGHPEPFRLKYLEIGNENNGPDYEERYERFRKEISARYPELLIVANTHVEQAGLQLDIADEHFYDKAEWFAENSHYYDKYDRKGPGIFVGEFAVVAGNIRTLYAALGEAMFMVGMERNQDVVKLASYAPLFENVRYAAWEPNLIAFDGLDNYAIPTYYVQKMFAENKGTYVLESSQECGKIYAPYLKGGPCLAGSAGVRFKNASWKGQPVAAEHEMFGCVRDCGDGTFITEIPENGPGSEQAKRFDMAGTVLVTLGNDMDSRQGVFEIEMLLEEGKELGLGMFATPYGRARNSEDSPWNLFAVQPVRWTIAAGMSSLIAGVGFRKYALAESIPLELENGVYHRFAMEAENGWLRCVVDGRTVTEIELPHYDEIQSIALEDGDEVIIKLVNIADEENAVEITLDCEVESGYARSVITGQSSDCNTLQEPERVTDRQSREMGAAKRFIYRVPANSVNVLRLTKAQGE